LIADIGIIPRLFDANVRSRRRKTHPLSDPISGLPGVLVLTRSLYASRLPTSDSLSVIPGRPKGEPGIPRRNLGIPGSPLPRRPGMTE